MTESEKRREREETGQGKGERCRKGGRTAEEVSGNCFAKEVALQSLQEPLGGRRWRPKNSLPARGSLWNCFRQESPQGASSALRGRGLQRARRSLACGSFRPCHPQPREPRGMAICPGETEEGKGASGESGDTSETLRRPTANVSRQRLLPFVISRRAARPRV